MPLALQTRLPLFEIARYSSAFPFPFLSALRLGTPSLHIHPTVVPTRATIPDPDHRASCGRRYFRQGAQCPDEDRATASGVRIGVGYTKVRRLTLRWAVGAAFVAMVVVVTTGSFRILRQKPWISGKTTSMRQISLVSCWRTIIRGFD